MNKWKKLFFVTLAAFALSNLFWIYFSVGVGFSQSHQQSLLDEKTRRVKMLSALVFDNGQKYTRKEFLEYLRQTDGVAFVVDKGDVIDVDGIQFVFINDRLAKINLD